MAQARPYARASDPIARLTALPTPSSRGPRLLALRGLAIASAGTWLAVAGCGRGSAEAEPTTAAPSTTVTVRDADSQVLLEAQVTGARCVVSGAVELTVDRATTDDGPLATAKVGATVVLTMSSKGDTFHVTGADGAARARMVRGARRTDVLSPDGVPLARISASGAEATVADASRAPVAQVVRDGVRLLVNAADGSLSSVVGTTDLELAALLAAPGVPADLRALLACDRLLAVASPSSGPAHSPPAAPASPDPAVSDPTP